MVATTYKTERGKAELTVIGGHSVLDFFSLLLIIFLVGLAIYMQHPPATIAENAPAADFSSARALKYLSHLAQAPHPIGSAEHSAVRQYLSAALVAQGITPEIQTTTVVSPSQYPPYRAAMVSNVLGRLKGTSNSQAVLLVAHYDTVPGAPGASDDGSSVAALLETARALKAGPPLNNDVIFLFTDAEEIGLMGAQAFVDEHPWAKDVKVVLNFEARGNGGPSLMFETSENNSWAIREFSKAARFPFANSLSYEIYKRLPNNTDLSVFKTAGFAGLNFAYIDGVDRYHTSRDNLQNIDERSLQHHGSYALALSRQFGAVSLNQAHTGKAVYFDLLGLFLVHYPASLAAPLALLSLLLLAVVTFIGIRKRLLTVLGLSLGVLALLASGVVAWGLVKLLWIAIQSLHTGYEYVPWGEPYNSTLYALSFLFLTVATTLALYVWFLRKTSVDNLVVGAMWWWAILGVVVTILIPGGSYLFTWPLLFTLSGFAISFVLRERRPVAARWTILLCAAPGLLLVSGLINQLFAALTLGGGPLIVILVVLLLGLLIPHFRSIPGRQRWVLPTIAGLLSLGFVIGGLQTAGFSQNNPKLDSIFYGLNADNGKALWASMDRETDEWTLQFLSANPSQRSLPELFPLTKRTFLTADAPAATLAPPQVQLVSDEVTDGLRKLHLRVTSPRRASQITLYTDENTQVIDSYINGKVLRAVAENAGPPNPRWAVQFYGLPDQGIELVLKVKPSSAVRIQAVDRSYGLEGVQGMTFKPRPDYMMPMSLTFSDAGFVSKTFTF